MRHFAANYIFTGSEFVKNACLTYSNEGRLLWLGAENSGLQEKERMYFLNGVICPYFDVNQLKNNRLSMKEFLYSLNVMFDKDSKLPVVLLENIDFQTMNFTKETVAREID